MRRIFLFATTIGEEGVGLCSFSANELVFSVQYLRKIAVSESFQMSLAFAGLLDPFFVCKTNPCSTGGG